MARRRKLGFSRAIWLAFGFGAALPSACGDGTECDGPGGLCISPPGADASNGGSGGGLAIGGSNGSGASSGSNAAGDSGEGGKGGDEGITGAGGTTAGGSGGNGGSGKGGTAGSFGGKGGTGGSSAGGTSSVCPPESAFTPSCDVGVGGQGGDGGQSGEAGAANDWCVPDSGSGGQGGEPSEFGGFAGETGGPGGERTLWLLDDFEDGNEATLHVFSGRGGWYINNDGSGIQYPSPCALPTADSEREGSAFAMRSFGRDFAGVPGGWAELGVSLRAGAGCTSPIDASAATGVRFWAKSSVPIRFSVSTVATNDLANGGECVPTDVLGFQCFDSFGLLIPPSPTWQEYFIPFELLEQEGWGLPATFDKSEILGLSWGAKSVGAYGTSPAVCFDMWIDDVAFYAE